MPAAVRGGPRGGPAVRGIVSEGLGALIQALASMHEEVTMKIKWAGMHAIGQLLAGGHNGARLNLDG